MRNAIATISMFFVLCLAVPVMADDLHDDTTLGAQVASGDISDGAGKAVAASTADSRTVYHVWNGTLTIRVQQDHSGSGGTSNGSSTHRSHRRDYGSDISQIKSDLSHRASHKWVANNFATKGEVNAKADTNWVKGAFLKSSEMKKHDKDLIDAVAIAEKDRITPFTASLGRLWDLAHMTEDRSWIASIIGLIAIVLAVLVFFRSGHVAPHHHDDIYVRVVNEDNGHGGH